MYIYNFLFIFRVVHGIHGHPLDPPLPSLRRSTISLKLSFSENDNPRLPLALLHCSQHARWQAWIFPDAASKNLHFRTISSRPHAPEKRQSKLVMLLQSSSELNVIIVN
ncbi:PREDICTED: uncharacterized protein LOC105971278 [Erythranthe guttata]|uniref:uncharacterized protein LOC105971278 n=1 Tax=Erythranthe guttata TaxID=4155 RepID=UPI00064DFEDB|nr:PREDICTED: uncharacterized protein LOC105971278 [Erythranthe guttata]|eukprot:XP_012851577.1 PREDICTED: uncharacterized protein LOC105971278 [Erythranthe guttata]